MSKTPVIKEYEAQFFGFSAHGFMNFYYNNLVESWTKIVDEVLLPQLLAHASAAKKKEKAGELREKLLDRLFQHGKFNIILNDAQKHLSTYILKVPPSVTLPEDEANLVENDEAELTERIVQLTDEIVRLQARAKADTARRHNRAAKLAVEKCLADEGISLEELL